MSILWQTISDLLGKRPVENLSGLPDFRQAGPSLTLPMQDGVQVVVPNSLDLLTPYILLEQRDWFEDEIKFLRRLLLPGQKIIDVGANYGVYTLSTAKTVGPSGRVWAFEPASATAKLLAEGIAVNKFSQITLDRRALSNASGTAQFALHERSEFNSLVHGQSSSGVSESVQIVTLDECLDHYAWRDIDFLKLDAEGEEANILEGGRRFFAELSPLVQYEVKDASKMHLELIEAFAKFGYSSYRLVPALDLLVRFDSASTPNGFLLNLFCCKDTLAEKLEARGFLLRDQRHPNAFRAQDARERVIDRDAYTWQRTIARLPYGMALARIWASNMVGEGSSGNRDRADLAQALIDYAISRDVSLSAFARWSALESSLNLLKILTNRSASHLRLATLARVARDCGERGLAVSALQFLLGEAKSHSSHDDMDEPFLAPAERFDLLPPGNFIKDWLLTAVLEAFEQLGSFSSFHSNTTARERLELICSRGFGSPEMERRLHLLRARIDQVTS